MCRNIRTLHNFAPPATPEEVHAAALQYVRKVSGSTKPALANQRVFDDAVAAVAEATTRLLDGLKAHTPRRTRAEEAAKAKQRWAARAERMRQT